MSSRLYVSNLSRAATLSNIRQLFSGCGDVLDVEFVAERSTQCALRGVRHDGQRPGS